MDVMWASDVGLYTIRFLIVFAYSIEGKLYANLNMLKQMQIANCLITQMIIFSDVDYRITEQLCACFD